MRASKRRKLSEVAESEAEVEEEAGAEYTGTENSVDGLGGMKWECLAVSLEELNAFVVTIEKSRDPNEKTLKKRISEGLLPLLEKQEEARKRKEAQKERELINLEKLATAKRSSRIAGKMELQKQEDEAREAERKRQSELAAAKKEQDKWMKLEKERESRMMTREQRLKEREARRILHEEELANLSEDSKKLESGSVGRLSERHLKAEIERKKQALEDLAEEEDWIFDCICGAYGQIDDGTHSIACDKCNIWQHSKCVGVSESDADEEDFHFVCKTCERRARDAERARTHPPIKIKLSRPSSLSSPMPSKQNGSPALLHKSIASPRMHSSPQKPHQSPFTGDATQNPFNQSNGHPTAPWQSTLPPSQTKPVVLIVPAMSNQQVSDHSMPPRAVPPPYSSVTPGQKAQSGMSERGSTKPHQRPYGSPYGNGNSQHSQTASRPSSSHAFSTPHPYSPTNLPPPGQNQIFSFVNGNAQQYAQTSLQNIAKPPPTHSFSSPSANNYPIPASRPVEAQPLHDGGDRRASMTFPSPISGAPVLTPLQKPPHRAVFSTLSSPPASSTPSALIQPSPNPRMLSPQIDSQPIQSPLSPVNQDPSQASALPPASTGVSPTKRSSPIPTTSNGSLGSVTPSVLPPVASLSPSPRLQILTPPVKPSHFEVHQSLKQGDDIPATSNVSHAPSQTP